MHRENSGFNWNFVYNSKIHQFRIIISNISSPKSEESDEFDDDLGNYDDDFYDSQFGSDGDGDGDGDGESDEYAMPEVDQKDVVVLKERTFTDVIENNMYVMVKFYAPWCGRCQALAPEYATAATQLKSDAVKVVLAKVDVQGFPTVLFFVDGEHKPYNGQRTKDAGLRRRQSLVTGVYNITTVEEAEKIVTSNDGNPFSPVKVSTVEVSRHM